MMQFAPVGSVGISARLEAMGLLGDYRLLLAHDVLAAPTRYNSMYGKYWDRDSRKRIGEPSGPLIIMDNSVVELGKPTLPSVMLTAIQFSYADVAVLADKMLDANATFAMSLNMQKGIKQHGKPDHLKYMGVVQGRTVEECIKCAANLSTIDDIGMLGVPKILVRDEAVGSRVVVTARIAKEFGLPIHLLGMSQSPQDDLEASQIPGVLGIDSSLPLRMAYDGLVLSHNLNNSLRRRSNDFLTDRGVKAQHVLNLETVRRFFGCQNDALDAHTKVALSEYGGTLQPTSAS